MRDAVFSDALLQSLRVGEGRVVLRLVLSGDSWNFDRRKSAVYLFVNNHHLYLHFTGRVDQ